MKIVILTSNILDGVIITENIIAAGKDVRAIVYEQKKLTLKSFLKRMLFRVKGLIAYTDYEGMCREKKNLIVKGLYNINSELTKAVLRAVDPDLIVVIGTRKLEKDIFNLASKGAINMHSGILPFYRGADSEFWALSNNEKDKIGVSIHFIDEGLDSGDVILTARQEVEPKDDYKSLRMKNIRLGAQKMVEAISLIENGDHERVKQNEKEARTYKSATEENIKSYRNCKRSV